MWQCQRRARCLRPFSAWRSLSSLFIFYGMVATQSCSLRHLFHHGMVNDTKQVRKSCNLRRLFHRGIVDNTKQILKEVL